jgi:hypothetical protein
MTGNGTARWLAVAALMGSLACSSTTARPVETGAAPAKADTNAAGKQGGTGDTTANTRRSQDTSRTRTPSDTANTGGRIHTDSASVGAPSNQPQPSQTDTTGQYRYRDSTGASSTARDTTMGKPTTRDTSRTRSR